MDFYFEVVLPLNAHPTTPISTQQEEKINIEQANDVYRRVEATQVSNANSDFAADKKDILPSNFSVNEEEQIVSPPFLGNVSFASFHTHQSPDIRPDAKSSIYFGATMIGRI